MNDILQFIQNFSGNGEQVKEINDYLSNQFGVVAKDVSASITNNFPNPHS